MEAKSRIMRIKMKLCMFWISTNQHLQLVNNDKITNRNLSEIFFYPLQTAFNLNLTSDKNVTFKNRKHYSLSKKESLSLPVF